MTKILVVDGEKDVCDFAVRFFEDRNFKAFSAINGNDAIQIIRNNRPDVVLLEMRMKNMGGMEILKSIKEISQDAKVIVVTDINDMEIMDQAKRLGAIAYLTKPILLNELLDIVLRNLGTKRRFFELNRVPKGG